MAQVIGLPVYLPIKIKVAVGLTGSEKPKEFLQWKQQQAEICAGFGRQEFTPCKGLYTNAPKIVPVSGIKSHILDGGS